MGLVFLCTIKKRLGEKVMRKKQLVALLLTVSMTDPVSVVSLAAETNTQMGSVSEMGGGK